MTANSMPPSGRHDALSPGSLPLEAELRAADLENDPAHSSTEVQRDENQEQDRLTRIRLAAYEAYQRRGGRPGGDVEDWLEAERAIDQSTPKDR